MSGQPAEPVPPEPIPLFPPSWFVENLNAGAAKDWCGDGPPPVRSALDPLVMYTWHLATKNLNRLVPMAVLSSVA